MREYYEDVFGATNVNRLAVGEEQAENFGLTKEQGEEATMHAEFEILGVKILCSDSFGRVDNINNGISLLIDFDTNDKTDSERVENFYNKIKDHESINIEMPLESNSGAVKWELLLINMVCVGCLTAKIILK